MAPYLLGPFVSKPTCLIYRRKLCIPKGNALALFLKGPINFSFQLLLSLVNDNWVFNSSMRIHLFKLTKNLYPPEGVYLQLLRCIIELNTLSILFGVGNGTMIIEITLFRGPFWKLENALSPRGTLRSRTQWGPFDSFHFIVSEKGCLDLYFQWRQSAFLKSWKCFIPRRDSAEQSPKGVQLFLLYILLV